MYDDNENEENREESRQLSMSTKTRRDPQRTAYNYADDNTASTVHPGRRQSMNYRNQRLATFYCD